MNSFAHIEINVSNLETSTRFYRNILNHLGWKEFEVEDVSVVGFSAPDNTHLFLVQTEQKFLDRLFHRKHTGLNHLAFRVDSINEVEEFSKFLDSQNISKLYHHEPKSYSSEYAMEHYHALFFEDPDRIKLEVVYLK